MPKATESNDGSLPFYSTHTTKSPSVRATLAPSYKALTVLWLVHVLDLSQSAVWYIMWLGPTAERAAPCQPREEEGLYPFGMCSYDSGRLRAFSGGFSVMCVWEKNASYIDYTLYTGLVDSP